MSQGMYSTVSKEVTLVMSHCTQVLRGSHLIGRIDHKRVGGQTGADMERVEHIKKVSITLSLDLSISTLAANVCMQVLPLEHVEMESGDALFFHSNLLHCSDQNHSARRRWAFLIAYNRVSNSPVTEHHHPQYTPLEMVWSN